MVVWDPPITTSFGDCNGKLVSLLSPGSEVDGKKVEHWAIYDQKKKSLNALDLDNCPEWLCVSIKILPHYQSTKAIKIFMKEFKKRVDILLKAQRSVTGYKAGRPRLNLYDEYLEVYDLHEKEKWTFKKIAEKMFPREFRNPLTNSRLPNPENAIKKVQYYHQEAKRMINRGWEWI